MQTQHCVAVLFVTASFIGLCLPSVSAHSLVSRSTQINVNKPVEVPPRMIEEESDMTAAEGLAEADSSIPLFVLPSDDQNEGFWRKKMQENAENHVTYTPLGQNSSVTVDLSDRMNQNPDGSKPTASSPIPSKLHISDTPAQNPNDQMSMPEPSGDARIAEDPTLTAQRTDLRTEYLNEIARLEKVLQGASHH
eukprot:c17512_g1_i1.p1 GENE.c17512_g1_i1~~c17512_g1_i1.p1  ORF type:complete len:206 (+),score=64.21 c17512_g1_i1:42-620(+)